MPETVEIVRVGEDGGVWVRLPDGKEYMLDGVECVDIHLSPGRHRTLILTVDDTDKTIEVTA